MNIAELVREAHALPKERPMQSTAPRTCAAHLKEVSMSTLRNTISAAAALLLIASVAGAQEHRRREVIPASELPAAGMCRVWVTGLPASRQSAATDCNTARANAPANSRIIYGNASNGRVFLDTRNPRYDPRLDPRDPRYDPRYDPRLDPRNRRDDRDRRDVSKEERKRTKEWEKQERKRDKEWEKSRRKADKHHDGDDDEGDDDDDDDDRNDDRRDRRNDDRRGRDNGRVLQLPRILRP